MDSFAYRYRVISQFSGDNCSHISSNQDYEHKRRQSIEYADYRHREPVDDVRLEKSVGQDSHTREGDDRG